MHQPFVVAVMALSVVQAGAAEPFQKPAIQKLGTIDVHLVETQPIVFRGKLYRFESVRTRYEGNKLGEPYFRFVDHATGEATPPFAVGHDLGCAFVEGDTMYAFGTPGWGAPTISVFWSKDLVKWEKSVALETEGWELFNSSVCKAGDRYVMAFEVGAPPEVVGQRFTSRFAESNDLKTWSILPEPAVFTKERYSACPTIRHIDGWYYVVYLEATGNYQFNPFLVRSRDLAKWEASPANPLIHFDADDKRIASPRITAEQKARIADALNRNNSDWDYAEFQGKLIINYSWGDQAGNEFLAEAVFDGTLDQFLRACFPDTNGPGNDGERH
jgi:hypothetical protein